MALNFLPQNNPNDDEDNQPQQQPGQPPQPPRFPIQTTTIDYDEEEKDDLTRYQLDLSKTKSDIAHWLNGDMPEEDAKGRVRWVKNEKQEYMVLNQFGIREVMRILNMYLTKDVILSNVKEEKINLICQDVGLELNDLFFTNYEEIGLDTDSKQKNYTTIILSITHLIYFVLMRSKDGKERQGVTENRNVNQNEIYYPNMQKGSNFSLNPMRGFRR
jgi:hypothetical protein